MVRQAQVVQSGDGELILRLVPDEGVFCADHEQVRRDAPVDRVGAKMDFWFENVDRAEPEPNGKPLTSSARPRSCPSALPYRESRALPLYWRG